YEAFSGGTQPSTVNPYAVTVMGEIGIDISTHRSKSAEEFRGLQFDYVTTVCDHAKETCPFFPGGKKYLHQGFLDPSEFKEAEEEVIAVFRQVRDDIRAWIAKTFG
ncbi:MAG: arsenate reductase ArsC, partial [Candidatus Binatia bacterium]